MAPPTARELKMLDPNRFPIIRPVSPLRAATIAVTNSGSEVPTATKENPTKPPLNPQPSARVVAPVTANWAPANTPTRPEIAFTKLLGVLISLSVEDARFSEGARTR